MIARRGEEVGAGGSRLDLCLVTQGDGSGVEIEDDAAKLLKKIKAENTIDVFTVDGENLGQVHHRYPPCGPFPAGHVE